MGIFTIPATSNVCELLSTMRDKEIIFPTTEADWKAWSACDVGAKIAAIAPVVSENYEYVVLDWSDNCVKRAPKPVVPATYDSNLLAPWTGYIRWAGNLSGGASPDNHPEFNMTLPEFTTDVYLMASWTIGKNSAATIEWYPKGPNPTTGIGYVNLVSSGEVISLPSWTGAYHGRTFTRRLYVKANTAGLKLGIWHNCTSSNGYVRMSAVAFKVY